MQLTPKIIALIVGALFFLGTVHSQHIVAGGETNLTNSSHCDTSNLTVYPNPNNGNFILNAEPENTINSAFIFDATGQIICEIKSCANFSAEVVNLTGLEKGVYFVLLNANNFEKRVYTKFLVE